MTVDEVISVLRKMGITNIIQKENQLQTECPLSAWFHKDKKDDRPSAGIKVEEYDVIFHCFACGESGKLWSIVDSYGVLAGKPEFRTIADELFEKNQPNRQLKIAQMNEDLVAWYCETSDSPQRVVSENYLMKFTELSEEALLYLKRRGHSERTADTFDLRFDASDQRIVYPVRNSFHQLTGAQGRTIRDDSVKYRNFFGFLKAENLGGLELYSEEYSKIFLVEGFLCLMRCFEWCHSKEVDANVFCTFGADLSSFQRRIIEGFNSPVVCFFDNDDAGNAGWEKMRGRKKEPPLRVPSLKRAPLLSGQDVDTMSGVEFYNVVLKLNRMVSII